MLTDINSFLKKIESHPSDKKIVFGEESYSYESILNKSYSLAKWINDQNCSKVFFNFKNSYISICLYLASMISNIEFLIPINPRLIVDELKGILEQNSLFITDNINDQIKSFCKINSIEIININSIALNINSIVQNIDINSQCIISHISSGTSGKYIKHQHTIKQIIDYSYKRVDDLGLKEDDKICIVLSLNHAYAFSYQLLPALIMGLDIVICKDSDLRSVANEIVKNKVTAIALLPTMYYFLLKENLAGNCLRYLSVAGDQPSEELFDQVKEKLNLSLLNGIGMTEVFGYGQNIDELEKNNCIKIFKDTEIKILKFDDNNYGKIFIKNSMLPINNKSEWLDSGDIGSFDFEKKNLHFYGRYKDIIIKGGSNISPIEIEDVIKKYHNVSDAIVIGKKDNVWGEIICAFIVSDKVIPLNLLNEYLGNYIAKYKLLDEIYYIKHIPITKTGKVDREMLKRLVNDK